MKPTLRSTGVLVVYSFQTVIAGLVFGSPLCLSDAPWTALGPLIVVVFVLRRIWQLGVTVDGHTISIVNFWTSWTLLSSDVARWSFDPVRWQRGAQFLTFYQCGGRKIVATGVLWSGMEGVAKLEDALSDRVDTPDG